MSDFNSSLPVRTETNGDVASKIVDATTPSQGLAVESNGNAQVKVHGVDPAAVDRILLLSEEGFSNKNGVYNVATNTRPAHAGVIAHTRTASPVDAQLSNRITSITASTVHALDISLHDENGADFSDSNPLPVKIAESEGTIVQDYKDAAAIAAGASDNHDYTVTAAKTLILTQVEASASGKAKLALQIETGVATGVFNTFEVMFNSTATPNMQLRFQDAKQVAAGVRVRVVMTNRDNQAEDLYSTIIGHEI